MVRRTGEYARLLAESTQPGLLADARSREEALEAALKACSDTEPCRMLAVLIQADPYVHEGQPLEEVHP